MLPARVHRVAVVNETGQLVNIVTQVYCASLAPPCGAMERKRGAKAKRRERKEKGREKREGKGMEGREGKRRGREWNGMEEK